MVQEIIDTLSASAEYYVHRYGGVYEFQSLGKSTVDASAVVVYKHVWPYAPEVWVRPAHEWESRFERISLDDLRQLIQSESLESAQERIKATKLAAKAKP